MSKTDQESINLQFLSALDKAQADRSTPLVDENLNLYQNMWVPLAMDSRNLIETLAVEIDGKRRLFGIVPAKGRQHCQWKQAMKDRFEDTHRLNCVV
jgi:hypothetical protein